MSKDIDNAFVDVRRAFRLLAEYQKRVLSIVNYIKEQTPYNDMWGSKWFSDPIGNRRKSPDSDYAKLSVSHDMWSWNYLYGYVFEYYFGSKKIDKKDIEMSIIQVSDDGFYISRKDRPTHTKPSTFESVEDSHSYIIINAGYGMWMDDEQSNSYDEYLTSFLKSDCDVKIHTDDKGHFFVCKRYPISRFVSQQGADEIIRDYGRIIFETSGIKLFKPSFY